MNTYNYVGANPSNFIDPFGLAKLVFNDPLLEDIWNNAIHNTPIGFLLSNQIDGYEGPDILVTSNKYCKVDTTDAGYPTAFEPYKNPKYTVISIDPQVMYELEGTKGDYWVGLPHILVHEISHGIGASEKSAIMNYENPYQEWIAGPGSTQRILGSIPGHENTLKSEKCGCGNN